MVDGFVAVSDVSEVAGVNGRDDWLIADYLDAKGGMGEEDDNGIGGMNMGWGRVAGRNFPFQQPEVRVFLDYLMMGFPVDGELGLQPGGKKEECQKRANILHDS